MKYILVIVWLTSTGHVSADPWVGFSIKEECLSTAKTAPAKALRGSNVLLLAGCFDIDHTKQGSLLGFGTQLWE
jgi:hypothetical protein